MSLRFWHNRDHCRRGNHDWYETYGNPDDPNDPVMFTRVNRCRNCPAMSPPERVRLLDIERELWEHYACKLEHEHNRKCEDKTFWAVCMQMAHVHLPPLILLERGTPSRYRR